MTVNREFAKRFIEANEGFSRAIILNNEALCSYYLGVLSGMLATALPENDARILTTVTALSADSINVAIQPVLSQAHEILRSAQNG